VVSEKVGIIVGDGVGLVIISFESAVGSKVVEGAKVAEGGKVTVGKYVGAKVENDGKGDGG